MIGQTIFDKIESGEYCAAVICSTLSCLKRALRDTQEFKFLCRYVSKDDIINRIKEVSTRPVEGDYRHPGDDALTVYVLAIWDTYPEALQEAADAIHKDSKNYYWLRILWDEINKKFDQTHEYFEKKLQ